VHLRFITLMSSVFEVVSAFSRHNDVMKTLLELFTSGDFNERLGKRIYVNFLDTVLKEGILNNLIASKESLLYTLLPNSISRLNSLALTRDLLNRDSNIQFSASIIQIICRDYIPMRSTDEFDSKLLVELVTTWSLFTSRLNKQGTKLDDYRNVLSFVFMKLCFCIHYFPTIDIKSALVDTLYTTGDPDQVITVLESTMGSDFWTLIKGVIGRKFSFPSHTPGKYRPVYESFLYDCIASPAISQLSAITPRSFPFRSKSTIAMSFLDLALFVRGMVKLSRADLLRAVPSIVSQTEKYTPFEMMVIRFAIAGPLVVGHASADVLDTIVSGILNPKTCQFFAKILEYISLQFMISKNSSQKASLISKSFRDCIANRPGYQDIQTVIKTSCPPVVLKFLQLEQLQAKTQTPFHPLLQTSLTNSDGLNETSIELNRLLEAIKRRRIE
jgi:hypothetical protein